MPESKITSAFTTTPERRKLIDDYCHEHGITMRAFLEQAVDAALATKQPAQPALP